MCISDKEAFPSPRSFRLPLRRQFSWPLSASDAIICIGREVNDLNDTLSNFKRKIECTTEAGYYSSKQHISETEKGKTKQERLYAMSLTKTASYMKECLLLRETRIACKNINFGLQNKGRHLQQYLLNKEKDDVTIPLATKIEDRTKRSKSNLFNFLFMLQNVPRQIYNVMPLSLGSYFESMSSGSTVGISESMSNNLLRLSSFSTFPRNVNIYLSRFTNAGFYYTGHSDTVTCYSCGVSYSNWTSEDNPLEIHKRLNPNCSHLQNVSSPNNLQYTSPSFEETSASGCALEKTSNKGLNTTNDTQNTRINNRNSETVTSHNYSSTQVSEGIGNARTPTTTASGIQSGFQNSLTNNSTEVNRDCRIQNGVEANNYFQSAYVYTASNANALGRNSGSNQNNGTSNALRSPNISANESARSNNSGGAVNTPSFGTDEDVPNLGINLEKPKYPNYAPMQVRISSYQNWPGYLDQTPQMMATAGFLYAGYNDYTRCFFCGGGLRNWEAGDDPWVEHARWFPKCAYLLQNKGARFIKIVQEKHQQVMAEQNNRENSGTNLYTQTSAQSYQNETQTNSANSPPSSQNPLETIAARSVLEMGYTNEQVLQAIEKLQSLKKEATTITATEIMTVLLDENFEGKATSSTQANGLVSTSGNQSATNSSIHESSMATGSKDLSSQNQNSSTTELLTGQGGTVETSSNDELASALDDTENLLQENQQLRDQRLCKVCLDLEASIAFLPCGHLVCCADCAPAMRKCPICRARVKGTVKTFLV